MLKRFVIAAVCCALPLAAARAQAPTAATTATDTTYSRVLTIQPINLVLTIVAGEYEQKLGAATTWGIGTTYWDAGPIGGSGKYFSGEVKLRYYPDGTALRGFSVGGSAGLSNISGGNGSSTLSAPSLGVLLEYQWLLGKTKSFVVAIGGGAKVLIASPDRNSSGDFTLRYPTARVSIGFAF